jgi:thiol:disulfide interchange protein
VVEGLTLNTTETAGVVSKNGIVTLQADMSDLDSEYYERCFGTLNSLGKTGLPVLAVFSPANPKSPIVLQGGWTKATLLEQLAIVVEENKKAPGQAVTAK